MSATELTGAAIVAQHLADVRTAAEPEQETLGRFAGKVKSEEPKLNGSELPLLLALLKIAEDKFKAQRPEIEKAIEHGMDPLQAFWVEKPTKTGTLSKKVSSTETFEQVYKRLVKWGWIVERHFNRKHFMRFEIGEVDGQPRARTSPSTSKAV